MTYAIYIILLLCDALSYSIELMYGVDINRDDCPNSLGINKLH
jgi:hypothetical protein